MEIFVGRLDQVAGAALIFAAAWRLARRLGSGQRPTLGAWLVCASAALWMLAAGGGGTIDREWAVIPSYIGVVGIALGAVVALSAAEVRRRLLASALLVTGAILGLVLAWGPRDWVGLSGICAAVALWLAAPDLPQPRSGRVLERGAPLVAAILWTAAWCYAAALLQVADAAARRMVAPFPRLPPRALQAPARFGWERVEFRAADGVPLVGWWAAGAQANAAILCHGHGDNKGGYVSQMRWLQSLGWSTFAFDFRTHGESGGQVATLGALEQRDLAAAIGWVQGRQAERGGEQAPLVLFGYSLGGAVATEVAAQDNRVDALVLEGTPPWMGRAVEEVAEGQFGPVASLFLPISYRLVWLRTGAWIPGVRPVDAIAHVSPRPVLVVLDMADRQNPPDEAQLLYTAALAPKELLRAPGARHVSAFQQAPAEYLPAVAQFLSRFDAQ